MNDAPERIWAFSCKSHAYNSLVVKASDERMTPDDVEFIRADIAQVCIDAEVEAEREACAVLAARMWPRGSAHTYASENADRYIALEDASERIAAAIRARGGKGGEG